MSFIEDIKKPANWIGYLIGIIGIVLSIIFYFYSEKSRNITYRITAPSLIYDSKNSSSAIKLIERDSVPITGNVYLVTGKIWNNGDLPIDMKDIRQPLSIELNNLQRILDYKITQQSDSAIAKFKLTKVNTHSLGIDWAYFDPKYGFDFQILYTGDTITNVYIKGKVLGITEIRNTIVRSNFYYLELVIFIVQIIAFILITSATIYGLRANFHYTRFIVFIILAILSSIYIYFRILHFVKYDDLSFVLM